MYGHHFRSFVAGYDAVSISTELIKDKITILNTLIDNNRSEARQASEDEREDLDDALNRLKIRRSELRWVITKIEEE